MAGFTGDIKVRSVHSGCVSAHNIVVSTEGKAYSFGKYSELIFQSQNYNSVLSEDTGQ